MIIRWLNSLGARITLVVVLALLVAQLIAILGFARGTDREQSEVRTENLVRQLASTAELLTTGTPSASSIVTAWNVRCWATPRRAPTWPGW